MNQAIHTIGNEGSMAMNKVKGIKPSGNVIEIIPLIERKGNKLRLYIDSDNKMKFYIETTEICQTLEVNQLERLFTADRYHTVLLQWSKDFTAIQIDGSVVARNP